jgi:AraC-like DNA-binding protein
MNTFLETRSYQSNFPVCAFYSQDNDFLAHSHIDVELVFVCEGSIRIGINQKSRLLNKGEIAVIGSTEIHYYDSRGLHSTIIVIIFRPEVIGATGGWPENLYFDPPFLTLSMLEKSAKKNIKEIFWNISKEMNEAKPLSYQQENGLIVSHSNPLKSRLPYYDLFVKGEIFKLCALLLRYFPTCSTNLQTKNRRGPDIQKIQFAICYLENNYNHNICLKDLAATADLSPYYFSRLFTRFTGMNFKEYLSKIRVTKAEQFIKEGQKSIIDISFECGFNSVRTFNRTFKKVKGYPPSRVNKPCPL